MTLISVVSPVFDEADGIETFIDEVSRAVEQTGFDWEMILVVDPGSDDTEQLIRRRCAVDPNVKMLVLTRRFGQAQATMAGIEFAQGDAVVVMDSDLQDPPEVVPRLVEEWSNGAKLVLATRSSRQGDSWLRRTLASAWYGFMNRFSEVPIPKNSGDFRLMDRTFVEQVKLFPERTAHLRGLCSLVGYEPAVVEFDRPRRPAGVSKYNPTFGSLKIAINGIVGFSNTLLGLSSIAGIVLSGVASLVAVGLIVAKLAGVILPYGYVSLMASIFLMGGLILTSLGIMGLYLGRVYEETKARPKYLVREALNIKVSS